MKACTLISCLFAVTRAVLPVQADVPPVQVVWRLLDYIAVDYPEAVQDGKVISETEFAEMTEFAASVQQRISELPVSGEKADLQRRANALQNLIAGKDSAATIATAAHSLADDLIKTYPVPLVPVAPLTFGRGQALYEQNCASCHGLNGDGKGPASTGLQPPPIAFVDQDRARERSVFALKQVIDQGLPGTSMAGFAALPPQDRWDLALYVGAFAYLANAATEGRRIWEGDALLRARINPTNFVNMTPAELANTIGDAQAEAVTAYLRRHPTVVMGSKAGPLTHVRSRLGEALTAYSRGDPGSASDLALSAYLDGFEPVEPILSARDNALMVRIEVAMAALRAAIAQGRPFAEVKNRFDELDGLFGNAESALAFGESSVGSVFLGAFTVLLREGLEALLIVVTMLAFLRKTDRRGVLPYVHGGWIAALAAGGLTWVAATYFIGISGASREMTEGFGSVFAAIVLLWVGVWMHGKSSAEAWQRYVCATLNRALTRRSAWFLFGLSFLVVYREVFETILFYVAIWNHENSGTVLAGGAAAIVALFGTAWMVLRYSRALPIDRFFSYSSMLIAALAVVLIGKGVAALQEAGNFLIHSLEGFPRIAALGLFPTREGIAAQMAVIVLLIIGMGYNIRKMNKYRASTT
ncbi:MAG: FTR1 family protein [Gammaproteobacteria bacterium]|nr:FTR1 family protein [Gammaproteobacteria bacterium]